MRKRGTISGQTRERMFQVMRLIGTFKGEMFKRRDVEGGLRVSRKVAWSVLDKLCRAGALEKVDKRFYRRVEPRFTMLLHELERETGGFNIDSLWASAQSPLCPEVNIERVEGNRTMHIHLRFKDGEFPDHFSPKELLEAFNEVDSSIYWLKRLHRDAKSISLRLISGYVAVIEH